jgi:hypothetical protein
MWLQLWSINEVLDFYNAQPYSEHSEYFFFASNGGLESIGLKLGSTEIYTFDLIDGLASAVNIAKNFKEFESAIGYEYKG